MRLGRQLSRQLAKLKKADDDLLGELILDWTFLYAPVAKNLRQQAAESARQAVGQVRIDDLKILDQASADAEAWAEDRAAELVGVKLVNGNLVDNPNAELAITASTRQALRDLVGQALTEGWSPGRLSQEIEESSVFSEARADMIARTELQAAHQNGNLIGWRDSGVVEKKRWILADSHPQDDECNDNAEQGEIDIDDVFSSGDDAPPAHPNCLCDLVAVTTEEATSGDQEVTAEEEE